MSGHMNVGVTVHAPDEISEPTLRRSSYAGQGIVTSIVINGAHLDAYEGYGCPPAALAARLRELADQIDAAAAAMTPTQGDAVEADHTEGDAHQPAPASAVCDGGDGQDVAGVTVEADPAQEGDGAGAGPATAPTTEHDPLCDDDGWDHPDPCVLDDTPADEQPRHVRMTNDYSRYRAAGGVASWDTWALRYGDDYPEVV
ncbi:MAG: hypothetical protein KDB37_15790 [Ilumatobacter sp.]|nr:hypothetical protein [Ilumatobacter sp.]